MDSLGPGMSLKGLALSSWPLTVAVKDKGRTMSLLRGSRTGPLHNIILACELGQRAPQIHLATPLKCLGHSPKLG